MIKNNTIIFIKVMSMTELFLNLRQALKFMLHVLQH